MENLNFCPPFVTNQTLRNNQEEWRICPPGPWMLIRPSGWSAAPVQMGSKCTKQGKNLFYPAFLFNRPCSGTINVEFSYSRLDSIVFNSKITSTYQESLIETQSQDGHNIYPRKPSRGRKPNKKFLCIRCIKGNPKIVVLLLLFCLSLSLLCATQVSEYVFK